MQSMRGVTISLIVFTTAFAFPPSRHDYSLHVVYPPLVSDITPDLQVDRRGSTVEIYPPTCVTPRSNHNGLDKMSRCRRRSKRCVRVLRENKNRD
jgi:hypothetical protein